MALLVNLIYFLTFTYYYFKYLNAKDVKAKLTLNDNRIETKYTGLEFLIIFIIVTGIMGLLPLLALHLAVVEIMCLFILKRADDKPIFSLPIKLFFCFIIWAMIGLFYTPSISFGIRMLLKYIYPPLVALAASAVVSHITVFLQAATWSRFVAFLSFIAYYLPMQGIVFLGVFWNRAALATNYMTWVIFSFSMYYLGVNRKRNLYWGLFFLLPCVIWVFRTNIFGTSVALAAFFFIRYRMKSIPLIIAMAALALCTLFYVPSVKSKMYFRPDEVTMQDFLTGNVPEENINTSGRNEMWKKVTPFYEEHKLIGSGTGRVQKYFYTEIIGFGRGGQLHNDLLLIQCDNGMIGLVLFLGSYIAILLHCTLIYKRTQNKWTRACVVTAGASLFGMLVTLYSDNTVSYSLATLGIPWAFYGMALGIYRKEQMEE